jgi:hypothetical protein
MAVNDLLSTLLDARGVSELKDGDKGKFSIDAKFN